MKGLRVVEDPPVEELFTHYRQHQEAFLHQHPLLPAARPRSTFGFYTDDGCLHAFALAERKPLRTLHAAFAPVGALPETLGDLLEAWVDYLHRQSSFWRLAVQLPFPTEAIGDEVLTALQHRVSFRHSDLVLNWSTWVTPLTTDEQALWHACSAHHRRNIRKARRLGLEPKLLSDDSDLEQFSFLYEKMYRHRKLAVKKELVRQQLFALRDHFHSYGGGAILGIMHQRQLAGAVVIAYRKRSAFYFLGASDPDLRAFPVMHGLFHYAMMQAAEAGFSEFDFGGYDLHARPGSQTANINRFKEGFGGEVVRYVPQLIFDIRPAGSRLTDAALRVRKWFRLYRG
ncbi:MAG: GNAT family N-acetyltransferase [Chitinophagales bacterium]|nr:GNAT family N-acetyltransferase [Chitinophagales bacterium]MDW8394106.1 GNAT family N-acetyltransferase [Chitinophagales bacterium]